MKKIRVPHLGGEVVVGGRRHPSDEARARALDLYAYLTRHPAHAVTPPPAVDYSPKALQALRQLYLNDVLGDCVIAEGYHAVGVATGACLGEDSGDRLAGVGELHLLEFDAVARPLRRRHLFHDRDDHLEETALPMRLTAATA